MRFRTITRTAARGFSLLELMLVLAIIGILMSVVAINVLGAGKTAKEKATKASMDTIKNALTAYNLEMSAFPPTLEALKPKFLDASKALKDAWGRDFTYDPRGRTRDQPYILGSAGEDGVLGNSDDIDVWTMYDTTQSPK